MRSAPGLNVITGETGAGKTLLAQAIGLLLGAEGRRGAGPPRRRRAPSCRRCSRATRARVAVARQIPRGGRARAHLDGLLSSPAAVDEAASSIVSPSTASSSTRVCCSSTASSTCSTPPRPRRCAPLERSTASLRAGQCPDSRARRVARQPTATASASSTCCAFRSTRSRPRAWSRAKTCVCRSSASGCATPASCSSASAARSRCLPARATTRRRARRAARGAAPGRRGGAARRQPRPAVRGVSPASTPSSTTLPAQLRDYLDELDVDPARRDAVELRHDEVKALLRKYGESADAVLASPRRLVSGCRRSPPPRPTNAVGELLWSAAQEEARGRGRGAQRRAPPRRARVRRRSRSRSCAGSPCRTRASRSSSPPRGEGWEALGPRGAEEVEFLFGANPACPCGRCARRPRAASCRGRCSRSRHRHLGNDVETLIFDEVDTGIGGVTASALGERLAALAEQHPGPLHHAPATGGGLRRAALRHREVGRRAADTTETTVRPVRRRRARRRALPHARRGADDRAARDARRGCSKPGGRRSSASAAAPCDGSRSDDILAAVIRGLAGPLSPARSPRTGESIPQNPALAIRSFACPSRRRVGVRRVRAWTPPVRRRAQGRTRTRR